MDYTVLVNELVNDPLSRGYAGMTDGERATSLNAVNRDVDVDTVSGQEIFEATVPTEYNALTDTQKALFHAIIGMGTIQVNGTNTKAALLAMFGAGTTTRANLALLQKKQVSRMAELGLPDAGMGHMESAREIIG